MTLKLGAKPPDYKVHRNWLEDYLAPLPGHDTVPASWPNFKPVVDRCAGVNFPMYLNDTFGDCTIAGIGHVYGAVSKVAKGIEVLFSDAVIESTYARNCPGFNPVNDTGDNGATLQGVLQDQYVNGMTDVNGNVHKVIAYAQLKAIGPKWLAVALDVFGSVYVGVNLPQSAENQFSQGAPWTYVQGSPIIGGHCITLQATNESKNLYTTPAFTFVTWGSTVQATWPWVNTYVNEAWVVITPDWLEANGDTVDGFDLAQLQADMAYCA